MVFLMPINMVVFGIVSKQRRLVLKYSDKRVKMMNEILAGIRIIKFYAWERPFGKEVGDVRGKELEALTKLAYTSAIGFSLILLSAPLIQPILVFLTYVSVQDEPLSAATAFTTVALFNIMRFPFAFLPMGLLQYIQSRISLKRLERYFDLPELPEYVEAEVPAAQAGDISSELGSITVQKGSFSWIDPDAKPIRPISEVKPKKEKKPSRRNSRSSASEVTSDVDMRDSVRSGVSRTSESSLKTPTITLQDLDFFIPAGDLVAVVGPVGSGKSSFLSALLGEMEPIHGSKVYIPKPKDAPTGFVSYCSQTPWVVNDTLRGNILFGRPFDQERYDQVVEACALLDDMVALPAGDMTEIGERGINLSGGQKARVSLARSLYSTHTKLMLMDDPLSAVDAHVGEHIFDRAIMGHLATSMTRILVTHHVHLLSRCDSVIVLEKGRVKHYGKYRDLVARGVDFAGAVDVSRVQSQKSAVAKQEDPKARKIEEVTDATKLDLKKKGTKLVKDEERQEGSVDGSAYWHYARSGGFCTAMLAVCIQAIGRGSEVGAGFWLAHWAEQTIEADDKGEPFSTSDTYEYLGVYAALGMFGVFSLTARAIAIAVHRLRASKILHDDLTDRVLRAPVAFFDVTPTVSNKRQCSGITYLIRYSHI
jgi:ATP-binding cassette subfamily C (CFTR/MRP) protein 1